MSVHGLDRAQPTPAWRCARPAPVSRAPRTPATPRDASCPDPSPGAHTHTPVSLPHDVRLLDSSPPPRDVARRAGCAAVFADSFPLPPRDVPSTPTPLWCPSLLAFVGPRGLPPPAPSSPRVPPPPRRPEDPAAARLRGVRVRVVLCDGRRGDEVHYRRGPPAHLDRPIDMSDGMGARGGTPRRGGHAGSRDVPGHRPGAPRQPLRQADRRDAGRPRAVLG